MDSYGPSIRVPPVFNAHGWLDSVNFGSAHAYDVYRGRAMLAARPYLLNGLDDDGVPVESIAVVPRGVTFIGPGYSSMTNPPLF